MNYKVNFFLVSFFVIIQYGCGISNNKHAKSSESLRNLFNQYWEERMQLFPIEATAIGDNRYNNQLPITISESYRSKTRDFYSKYITKIEALNEVFNEQDETSKELFLYELNTNLEALKFPSNLMPINQFWSFTLEFPQLGSGTGNQPFKSVKDYDNFLERIKMFPAWIDTAIANMRIGVQKGMVLPKILAERIIPQCKGVLTIDPTKNIFYEPIKNYPKDFSEADKKRLENAYFYNIGKCILPAYSKLRNFIEKEYLPACRETHGVSSIPNGAAYYQYLIQQFTTTTLSPDSIYNLGIQEVARIKSEMEKVKREVGYKGTLTEFFTFINEDKQFYPFKEPKEVIDSFMNIQKIEDLHLNELFSTRPKTKFEIRQTEAFRAASASAEYNAGSEDGTRPGIFYVPVLEAKKFNIVGMETLFLHEAIPGHHYQISLQQENDSLPKFRKFLGYSAYAEGWALYTETLGKQLGLYKNPYQYLGHLSDAMHRAIRLVVDVAIHTKGMSHDEAIGYMMQNERISKEEASAEIERYMAIPGQALSYKIGQLTIMRLKEKCEKELGSKFDIREFHTQLLDGGNMPLEVLQKKLARWVKSK
jgi:uncharacterized protein (DUF885 family)